MIVQNFESLLEIYKNDPVSFVFVDPNEEQALHEQLGNKSHKVVVYRPKRSRYMAYKGADYS